MANKEMAQNTCRIMVDGDQLCGFEENFLMENKGDYLIPMSFSKFKNKWEISYNVEGNIRGTELEYPTTGEAIVFLKKVLETLRIAEEYILEPSKITLSLTTVFINKEDQKVRFLYIPNQNQKGSVGDNILKFISEMEQKTGKEARAKLNRIRIEASVYNLETASILDLLNEKANQNNLQI